MIEATSLREFAELKSTSASSTAEPSKETLKEPEEIAFKSDKALTGANSTPRTKAFAPSRTFL